jgi:hypothetical protein
MENLIIQVVLMNNRKMSLQQFLPLPEAEIQGLLHSAEATVVSVSPAALNTV